MYLGLKVWQMRGLLMHGADAFSVSTSSETLWRSSISASWRLWISEWIFKWLHNMLKNSPSYLPNGGYNMKCSNIFCNKSSEKLFPVACQLKCLPGSAGSRCFQLLMIGGLSIPVNATRPRFWTTALKTEAILYVAPVVAALVRRAT